MPLQINRPVTVYRLWDNDDLRQCFNDLAGAGWLCSLVAYPEDDSVKWGVRLQLNRTQVAATLDDVVVSDLVTVVAQTVGEYNAANPDNQIVGGS